MNIALQGVSFFYAPGVQALAGVDLEIGSGEQVALIGANGAGKTTLAKHLNGLLRPAAGAVWIGDWNAADHSVAELAGRVSYAFQNPADQLFARTVRAEIGFGPRNLGLPEQEVQARVSAGLQQVGLQESADCHPYDLSPSERKLLSLAAAIAQGTPVLVLDEPTSGQDRSGVQRVAQVLQAQARSGTTALVITHDLDFCAKHLERVVLMAGGRILADGPARHVLADEPSLERSMLEPPQLIRLTRRLEMQAAPLDVSEFVEAYRQSRSVRP